MLQTIEIGKSYKFNATVYSEKGLQVQEFLFGIPEIGKANLAEVAVEVWFADFGEIKNIQVLQKSNVIDSNNIKATHEKTKCDVSDKTDRCDSIEISVIFLEPLKDKIIALKAIDQKKRYQITYLNEGIDLSGDSLNALPTAIIPSPVKNEGPIKVTQTKKYNTLWQTEDGRIFERNEFGSFRQVNQKFERFHDSGEPLTRDHSEFWKVVEDENSRMIRIFNASEFLSELPDSFEYSLPEKKERINQKIKDKMFEQEVMAQKIIEKSNIQARFSNTEFWPMK